MRTNVILLISVLTFLVSCSSKSQTKNVNLDNYTINQTPKDWSVSLTGKGDMCEWKIMNDNGHKVLKQTSAVKKEYRFNLITLNNTSYKDVDISVDFKGVDGELDQGGGPLWRYIDENNYYVARANPLENNYRVYKVVSGKRIELGSADININTNHWYTLRVRMKDNKIQCYFNEKLQIEVSDDALQKPGKIGLWTKSDAQTYFNNLKINNF